jgi:3-hydroxybutyryl-CoA dehydrogenase
VSTIGIIGAGVMGRGIAQVAASKDLNVVLVDLDDGTVKKGIDDVSNRLTRQQGQNDHMRMCGCATTHQGNDYL